MSKPGDLFDLLNNGAIACLGGRWRALWYQSTLALLKESLATGEGFDPSGSEMLAPPRSSPDFARLVEQAQKRYPTVHKAKVAFTVPEKDLFPEGLAYDPAKQLF